MTDPYERCDRCGAFKAEGRGPSGDPDDFVYFCRNPKHPTGASDD